MLNETALEAAVQAPVDFCWYECGVDPETTELVANEVIARCASVLWARFVQNHSFVDGNKRAGLAAGLVMLRANGLRADRKNPLALEELTLAMAKGEAGLEEAMTLLRDLIETS